MRQFIRSRSTVIPAAAAVTLAGLLASPTFASARDSATVTLTGPETSTKQTMSDAAQVTPRFVWTDRLVGSRVTDRANRPLGVVSDLIVDRGSGRIEYVILSTADGVLGFGVREVAVPYASFLLDESSAQLRLEDVTPDVLEDVPEFDREQWLIADSRSWADRLQSIYDGTIAALSERERDPLGDAIDGEPTLTIKGTVKRTERVDRGDELMGSRLVVHVRTADGIDRPVVMGPTWFVMSQPEAPVSGDPITVTAWDTDLGPDRRHVAQSAVLGDRRLTLRSRDGEPAWMGAMTVARGVRAAAASASSGPAVTSPFILHSEMSDCDVRIRGGEAAGELQGSVTELRSGRIALLAHDPNVATLGIGDTLRGVPWSLASIGPDRVKLDMQRDQIMRSHALPEDRAVITTYRNLDAFHVPFSMDTPTFEPRDHRVWAQAVDAFAGWSDRGVFGDIVREGTEKTVEGVVVAMRPIRPAGSLEPSMSIRVRSDDDRVRTVLLGPAWYLERQDIGLGEGTKVSVTVVEGVLAGEPVIVARRVELPTDRELDLWTKDRPAWVLMR